MRKIHSVLFCLALLPFVAFAGTDATPDLKGSYTRFGVMGSPFQWRVKNGDWDHLEGGINFFKTYNGQVWFSHFELDMRPLEVRKVYLVRLSGDKKIGCGELLPDYTTAPARCIAEERILSWAEAKRFLSGQIHDGPKIMDALEREYRGRSKK